MLLWQKKKKTVHHIKESSKKQNIYEKCIGEIGELFTTFTHEEVMHSKVLFFQTLRSFFADFLNIRYQFTYEELVSEIDKRNMQPESKKAVKEFLVKIQDMEYSREDFDVKILEVLLRNFGDLILMLKKEFLEHPPELVEERHVETLAEKLKWVIGSGLSENFEKMKILAERLEKSVAERNLMKSREIYQESCRLFDRLPPEHKKILYPRLIELYEKILELHE